MRRALWVIAAAAAILGAGVFGTSYAGSAKIRITNGLSSWDIHFIYISPASAEEWGPDRLSSDQILHPGESVEWTISSGRYDIRCQDEDRDTYTRYNVRARDGRTYQWRVTLDDLDTGEGAGGSDRDETTITIVNDLESWDIHYVYISAASSDEWGPDRLSSDQTLEPGERETWTADPGRYDIRCQDEDRDTYTRHNVRIRQGQAFTWRVTLDDLDSD